VSQGDTPSGYVASDLKIWYFRIKVNERARYETEALLVGEW